MFLHKNLFFTFLILYEMLLLINSQEYLKDLKPKDFKSINYDELPPVELPRPIVQPRSTRALSEEPLEDELPETESRLKKSQRNSLMDIALEASVREGLNAMRKLYTEVEPDMVKNGQFLEDNHPAALLSKFSAPVVESTRSEMAAYATLTAAKVFRKNYDLNSDLARQAHSHKVSLRRTALESLCPSRDPPTCMPASERYRTHDGTCNNKRRLRWGAAQMPFNRFIPPEYGDGVDTTRKAVDGGHLSSSRFVSLLVHGARDGEAPLTLMLAQWGQLLDHDLTSTAQPRSINGSVPSCCGSKDFHPSCFPIKVPLDDPWLSSLKVRCLEFLRSAPAQRRDCVLSWREQTNQATSYIDASPIYSSSVKSSDNARVFRKGLLIFGRGNSADDVCQRGALATHCIRSGDGRSGEQPGLLALHHVWVHEHNHIAMKLSEMNLHWSDEKIYQETRRIIGATFQHITYREFLPIVLGREVVKLFDLELKKSGYYEGYDPKINPTVANAFASAAFRFGHSLVQNSYMRCDRFHNVINSNVSLHEEFQRGDIGSVGSLHRLLRGMATQKALKRDEFITPELTNHLFQTPGFPFGLDLAAINIQRGRDHGVPPYTHWRVPCGLTPINSWEEFANVVGPESARRISHAYQSVHDIDLFVGGIAERPVVGGLVGPTFACIIAQQFSNSRKGDRFWYENPGFESSFTPAQLHSIRRVSLASVLCRAVGGGTFQPHIFLPPDFPNNERLPCGVAPLGDFDINPWLEQDPFVSLPITHTEVQHPSLPTFKPQVQPPPAFEPQPPLTFKPQTLPDRVFDLMQLETKSPENTDTPLSDSKVGFSNRNPAITVLKDQPIQLIKNPHNDFVPNTSSSFLTVRNTSRINDKLDIKRRGSPGHITKQKPPSGVNNKLDKNNRKGGNRHGVMKSPTRIAVVVNNIPIELRNAGRDTAKNIPTKSDNDPEARTGNADFNEIITNVTQELETPLKLEAREEDKEDLKLKTNDFECKDNTNKTNKHPKCEIITQTGEIESKNKPDLNDDKHKAAKNGQIENQTTTKIENKLRNTEATDKTETEKLKLDLLETTTVKEEIVNNTCNDQTKLEHNKNEQADMTRPVEIVTHSRELDKQTEMVKKIITVTKKFLEPKLENESSTIDINDFDIDPVVRTTPIEHKRVQRRLMSPSLTDKLKEKLKQIPAKSETFTNLNKTLTTKAPKPFRSTLRTVELRQYQNRPSFTKTPQKVIVDSVNGDNQYEIEINIRQSNKNPKPLQSTPYIGDYTNAYKPNQFDRYTTNHQTTPIYAYYQPAPTQISTIAQNQRTKPPTVIFVNDHEERMTTRQPGYLQGILGWNSGTKRPLPASIGVNERPGFETIIGSPHSTANIQPVYQKPPPQLVLPASSSSFSQAQVGSAGIAQVSSGSVSNGNFGSIAGFTSSNGADSTFSFNIRPKPDKTQNARPIAHGGSYGLVLPPRDSWYQQNTAGQHISTYDIPYRENVNSPFSTLNSKNYFTRNKTGPQSKVALKPGQEYADYDYLERTLQPLSNITSSEDKGEDYEYDEDYGTSPLLKKFNEDGYLRPEHMIDTLLKSLNNITEFESLTADNAKNLTLDDDYVLPALNSTKEIALHLPKDLPKPLNINLSTTIPDALGKNLNNNIFAEEEEDIINNDNFVQKHLRNRDSETMTQVKTDVLREVQRKRTKNPNKNNARNHEKIAFAPLNVLTKPERPDNWVFFDSPQQEEPSLPQIPELIMDPVPSAEVPKPLKENIWLDLSKIKKNVASQNQELKALLKLFTDKETDLKADTSTTKNIIFSQADNITKDKSTYLNKNTSDLTNETVTDLRTQDVLKN